MYKSKSKIALFSDNSVDNTLSSKKSEKVTKKSSESPLSSKESASPHDFDAFVPWVCAQWEVHDPVIIKVIRGYEQQRPEKGIRKSSRSNKSRSGHSSEKTSPSPPVQQKTPKCVPLNEEIPVTAHYDHHSRLIAISIIRCRQRIPKKLIKAFRISAYFHNYLNKLTIRYCTLTSSLLCEIGALLFNSNITEICLDDTFVSKGNYYTLLDEISQLKYLSLSRCKINDAICIQVVQRMEYGWPAANSLQVLDLASNFITDKGAVAIGEMLRRNRHLLHINLSGNKIGDEGMTSIMNALMEYPLTREEIMEMKSEKLRFLKKKNDRCLNEISNRTALEETLSLYSSKTGSSKSKLTKKRRKTTLALDTRQPEEIAATMAIGIVGEFHSLYGLHGVLARDGYYYARGNFVLCSLNVGYNNLEYPSVKKVNEVVSYQRDVVMLPPHTGLMRLLFDGNYIANTCPELENIAICLNKKIGDHTPQKLVSSQRMRQYSVKNI